VDYETVARPGGLQSGGVVAGVWGQSPQRGPGAEPLVRGAKAPPEAE